VRGFISRFGSETLDLATPVAARRMRAR
jgi:hypothetical protein